MLFDFLLIGVGIFGLYFGGKYLVRGSVGLSLRYGISPMIVGLTVMAFGTSAPELFVSVRSALSGHADLAFGNIVGSNIANILLILGVPAIVAPLRVDKIDSRVAWAETMAATLLFAVLVQFVPFGRWQGLVLLAGFVLVIGFQIHRAMNDVEDAAAGLDESVKDNPLGRIIFWLVLGIVLLPLGGEALVQGAVDIAKRLNVSEAVIGLTILAVGTSLPELAASVLAARKGETALAMGNVLGSCLFNILLILGVTGVIAESVVDPKLVSFDVPIMVIATASIAVFIFGKRPITRGIGLLMVAAYFVYILSSVL